MIHRLFIHWGGGKDSVVPYSDSLSGMFLSEQIIPDYFFLKQTVYFEIPTHSFEENFLLQIRHGLDYVLGPLQLYDFMKSMFAYTRINFRIKINCV